jgi:hypothetical protein
MRAIFSRCPIPSGVRAIALCVAATAVLLVSCRAKPAAGGKCKEGEPLVCPAHERALVCVSGAWVEMPCKGLAGCSAHGDSSECDDTLAAEGDTCPRDPPVDYACTPDHAEALVCDQGRFTLWRRCRGPERCQVEGGRNVRCDTTLGEPGDPCGQPGTYSCSSDRTLMLSCDGTSFHAASSCRGPAGCSVERESRKVQCDDAVAMEGDACDQPKRIACSVDGTAELMCSSTTYQHKRDCRRTPCHLDGNELFCD